MPPHVSLSPEGKTPTDMQSFRFVMNYAASFFNATIATLGPTQLSEIVFDIIPRKMSIDASAAASIIEENRAFYAFLKREFGLEQADACLEVLSGDAVKALEVELSDQTTRETPFLPGSNHVSLRGMTDAVNGFVRGHTIVLEAALPELEGRRVRVTVEALDDSPPEAEAEHDALSIMPPMAQLIGRSVVSTSQDGSVELTFEGSPRFSNRFGSIQGGMLAAMLDSTLAYSAMAALQPGQRALTVEMSTRFFQPATPGRMRARASLLSRSKNLAHAQADLYDTTGARVAHATGSLRIVSSNK